LIDPSITIKLNHGGFDKGLGEGLAEYVRLKRPVRARLRMRADERGKRAFTTEVPRGADRHLEESHHF